MKGIPDRVEYCAIPAYYINEVMPAVSDLDELKLTLHLFRILYRKKGRLQYVTCNELKRDPAVLESMIGRDADPDRILGRILEKIIDRGVLASIDNGPEPVYFVNTAENRKIAGGMTSPAEHPADTVDEPAPRLPDIFEHYEQNVGLLTPLVADELRLAEKTYPQAWIVEAVNEAVLNNKRSWRYIAKILDTWQLEGKSGGSHRKDHPDDDPTKYTRGKYGKFVRH